MKKFSLICQMLLAMIFPSCGQNAFDQHLRILLKKTVPLIQPNQLAAALQQNKSFVLLDTRSLVEYNVSHLPEARFVDFKSFTVTALKNIPLETPIVVYCSMGVRSERIGEKLQQAGYKNVQNLYGGIFEWKNKGFAVVSLGNVPTDSVHAYNHYWGQWLVNGIKVYE